MLLINQNLMRTILIFGAVIVGISVLAAIFRPAPAEQQPAIISSSVLGIENNFYDFGTVSMEKGEVVHEFKVKNTGTEEIKIGKIYTSCMCTVALFIKGDIQKGPFGMAGHGYISPVNELLVPNEEAIIQVVFDPAAHGPAGVGPIKRLVHIESDGSMIGELEISANVIP